MITPFSPSSVHITTVHTVRNNIQKSTLCDWRWVRKWRFLLLLSHHYFIWSFPSYLPYIHPSYSLVSIQSNVHLSVSHSTAPLFLHPLSALQPSLLLLVYNMTVDSFLMSSEMRGRDQWERTTWPNIQFPSLINYSLTDFFFFFPRMRNFILKLYTFFMSPSSIWLHLF